MKIFKVISLFLLFGLQTIKAQHFIESDIWLADVRIKESNIYFGAAKNITNAIGYDSQPFFLNDSILLYTHIGEDLQADIYQYHLKKKANSKYTNTKESEYSAKLLPNNNGISVVEVEQDSTQRIWTFDLNGNNLISPFGLIKMQLEVRSSCKYSNLHSSYRNAAAINVFRT